MKLQEVIAQLLDLGYRLEVKGEKVRYRYVNTSRPPSSQANSLLSCIKLHKAEALAFLKKNDKRLVGCRDCQHAELGHGYAMCQAPAPGMVLSASTRMIYTPASVSLPGSSQLKSMMTRRRCAAPAPGIRITPGPTTRP